MDLTDNLEIMMANAELRGTTCGLKHSEADPADNHPAINYLCQHLGDQKHGPATSGMRIPICEECQDALGDKNWILAYCMYCNASQWIYRPKSKIQHPEGNGIYWLDVCPHCAEVETEYKGE